MVSLPAYRCTGCGTVSQPRRARCRQCGRTDVEQVELRRGKLLTFTRVTATRPGYPTPMILCLAEFEYGVKLVAQVDDPSPNSRWRSGRKCSGRVLKGPASLWMSSLSGRRQRAISNMSG